MPDTPSAGAPPTLDELRAIAAAANSALAEREAADAIPLLSLQDATEQLQAAEQVLETAERPFWDVEHAQVDLGAARATAEEMPRRAETEPDEDLKAAYLAKGKRAEAAIPGLEAALATAKAALDAHPIDKAAVDVAAQAVVDGRAALEKAQAAEQGV